MKIQSVWGITVDWQAHGSQAVICTPVIWSMVIIAVCVCVHAEKCMRLLLWADEWQFKQTHNVVNQKIKKQTKNKKAFSVWPHLLLHLYASMRWWNSTEPYFYFILFSHWVTAFASLPPSSIHSPLCSFIPLGGAEKTLPCSIGFERR